MCTGHEASVLKRALAFCARPVRVLGSDETRSKSGQFSPEDRPDDPPLSEDDLLRQVTTLAGHIACHQRRTSRLMEEQAGG